MNPDVQMEMERLVSALCDEQLGDEEFARLEALLAADPACRQMYLEYVDMHASLLIDPRFCDRLSHPAPAPVAPATQAKANPAVPATVVPAQDRTRPQVGGLHWGRENFRHVFLVLGVLAASLLVQVFWMPPLFSDRKGEKPNEFSSPPLKKGTYVATLVQSVDCEWDVPRSRRGTTGAGEASPAQGNRQHSF